MELYFFEIIFIFGQGWLLESIFYICGILIFDEIKGKMIKMKKIFLACAVSSMALSAFAEESDVLLCNAMAGCTTVMEETGSIEEFGEERAFEMVLEQTEDLSQTIDPQLTITAPDAYPARLGMTFSEALGLGKIFLAPAGQGFYAALSGNSLGEPKALESYRTVEFAQINESLVVIVYKPVDRVVIRRDGDNSARVIMTYAQFIDTLQQAYPEFSSQKVSAKYFNKMSSITDTITRISAKSRVVSNFGPNLDFEGEYFREDNLQHTTYRSYADRPFENRRDPSHSTGIVMEGGGGYTASSLSVNGNVQPMNWIFTDAQVKSTREELGTNTNGDVKITRGLEINIDGEDSIVRNGSDDTYCDWGFSGLGLLTFGGGDCESTSDTPINESNNNDSNETSNGSTPIENDSAPTVEDSPFEDFLSYQWGKTIDSWNKGDTSARLDQPGWFDQKHNQMRNRYYGFGF